MSQEMQKLFSKQGENPKKINRNNDGGKRQHKKLNKLIFYFVRDGE